MFSEFFTSFLKSKFNFVHLGKKDEPYSLCISEIINGRKRSYVNV